jgi:hypothetical protein
MFVDADCGDVWDVDAGSGVKKKDMKGRPVVPAGARACGTLATEADNNKKVILAGTLS